MSSIFSYLLFGQDLSEVSGSQALQLASTVATFAGEGPDILELTRKSLGIDRLQIVMTPTGTAGEETLSLQVGKIVFPGFLVIIKQGADDSSPNIAIEVDLTHGFTFEAESEQQPAQGKFSLQWNLNY
jgi:autotransporter translocation and assembly factor TamB